MSKLDKLREANQAAAEARKKQLNDELDRAASTVSQPNPLASTRTISTSNSALPSTFTRESPIASVVCETGNRTPYFLRVAYGLIDPNPFNARATYKPERIHKMSSEIKADGQMVPGIATIRDGRIVLAAGHYRWKGIGVAQISFMDLMIYEGITDRELYKLSYKENAERSDQSVLDNAIAWKKLLDQKIYENESAIAEETGISLSNINKILSVLNLPKAVLDYVNEQDDFKFALSSLYELQLYSNVAGPNAALEMVKKIVVEDYTRDKIKDARTLLEQPKPARKTKETARQYKIHGSDESTLIGHVKEFDSGKILLEVNIDDDERKKEILTALKSLFQIN